MELTLGGPIGRAAFEQVRTYLDPAILNHSVRVWLIADQLGRAENLSTAEREALAVACLFHDAGTADRHDGPQRFEVEGADAAVAFLAERGCDPFLRQEVWNAIALHTSAGIAERIGLLPRLVRWGVLTDFGATDIVSAQDLPSALHDFPRAEIERVLGDAVVRQALRQPSKAPAASWPGALVAAHAAHPEDSVNRAF